MKISENGINFIIHEEGERLKSYKCPAGVWTVGVGHTGKDIQEGLTITKELSRNYLKQDLIRFENTVNKFVKVKLTQNQFDTLVSFSFNVGTRAFQTSTLLKKINNNAPKEEIKNEFKKWRRGGGRVLPVLVARRQREIELYFKEGIL